MRLSSKDLNRILDCKNLDQLCDAVNSIECLRDASPMQARNAVSFPVFGGLWPYAYAVPTLNVISWDLCRLLVKKHPTGWLIVSRSDFCEEEDNQ